MAKNTVMEARRSALAEKVLRGERALESLDFTDGKQVMSAREVLDARPAWVRRLDLKRPDHHKFVVDWLNAKTSDGGPNEFWSKLAQLDPRTFMTDENNDNAILSLCLQKGLIEEKRLANFAPMYSFTNQIVMNMNYETAVGEEIVYHDKLLDLPTSLVVRATMNFKILDTYKFMKFLDVHPQQINPTLVYSKIVPDISSVLRSAILSVIEELDLSYYRISTYYDVITGRVITMFNTLCAERGMQIVDLYIANIKIPSNVAKILEEKKLEAMQIMEDIAVKNKAERLALDNYEKKAQIHQKYPEFAVTLSEREKDNAVERYNIKNGNGRFHHIKRADTDDGRKERKLGLGAQRNVKTFESDDTEPVKKPNKFILLGILTLIVGIIIAIASGYAGGRTWFGVLVIATGIVLTGFGIAKNKSKKIAELKDSDVVNPILDTTPVAPATPSSNDVPPATSEGGANNG